MAGMRPQHRLPGLSRSVHKIRAGPTVHVQVDIAGADKTAIGPHSFGSLGTGDISLTPYRDDPTSLDEQGPFGDDLIGKDQRPAAEIGLLHKTSSPERAAIIRINSLALSGLFDQILGIRRARSNARNSIWARPL